MEADAPYRFALDQFGQAALGDARRTRRLVQVAAAFVRGAGSANGGTINSVIRDWSQAKAAYRLLDGPELTHAAVTAAHGRRVLAATAAAGDYLLIEDSTTVAYPDAAGTRGLGPIGEDYTRGLWVHSTLVVKMDWPKNERELLGLLGQRVWTRPVQRPTGRRPSNGRGKECNHTRQKREDRESQKWMAHLEASAGPALGSRWTYVADRESDIYELFQKAAFHGWNYVIRAVHRRALAGAWAGQDLFAAAAAGSVRGQVEVELPRQKRKAKLEVRSTSLELRGPPRPGGRLENQKVNVIWAREIDPPQGQEPVHWVLLTDQPVESLEQCQRVLAIYACRWLIEEWHKALKTGLGVEESQLSDARRLAVLLGILSVVAVFLVRQKLLARADPQAPLDPQHADPAMVAVLSKLYPCGARPTRGWFWLSIARLGGFLARTGDGDPGWLTLWRGWQTLMTLVLGYELADTS